MHVSLINFTTSGSTYVTPVRRLVGLASESASCCWNHGIDIIHRFLARFVREIFLPTQTMRFYKRNTRKFLVSFVLVCRSVLRPKSNKKERLQPIHAPLSNRRRQPQHGLAIVTRRRRLHHCRQHTLELRSLSRHHHHHCRHCYQHPRWWHQTCPLSNLSPANRHPHRQRSTWIACQPADDAILLHCTDDDPTTLVRQRTIQPASQPTNQPTNRPTDRPTVAPELALYHSNVM